MKVSPVNNINYRANLEEQYQPLKHDVVDYVLNSDRVSVKKLNSILKKYADADFVDFKELPVSVNPECKGYTQTPLKILSAKGEVKSVELMPEKVYVKMPTGDLFQIALLSRILHECTHVFQRHSDDRVSEKEVCEKLIDKNPDFNTLLNNINAVDFGVFSNIEDTTIGLINKTLPNKTDFPQQISAGQNLNTILEQNTQQEAHEAIKSIIEEEIKKANQTYKNIDRDFILENISYKAQREAEAYKNGLEIQKELLGINYKTDYDIRVEAYLKIAQCAQNMQTN